MPPASSHRLRFPKFTRAFRHLPLERLEDRLVLTTIASDDFSSLTIDANVWTFVDPVGDAELVLNGESAEIRIPSGRSHDLWTNALRAPRLLQDVSDDDFEVEVKFESDLNQRYQMQGLVAQQDSRNLIRFDVYHDGNTLRAFAATITNGRARVVKNSAVSLTAPLHLRMNRSGATWTLSFSDDGGSWRTHTTFEHRLRLTQLGPFAGNHTPSPAHTSSIDHFFSTTSGEVEEVPSVPGNLPPIAVEDSYQTSEDQVLRLVAPGLVDNDSDPEGQTLRLIRVEGYDAHAVVSFNADGAFNYSPSSALQSLLDGETATDTLTYTISDGSGGRTSAEVVIQVKGSNDAPVAVADQVTTDFETLVSFDVLANDRDVDGTIDQTSILLESNTSHGTLLLDSTSGTFSYTPADGFFGRDQFAYTVADDQGLRSDATNVVIDVGQPNGPAIDIWYDSTQEFGALGRPQEWVNVLGNVRDPDGISSLTYSLNGGSARRLNVGHDRRRLVGVGDFNIEVDADDLRPGSNTVVVTAVDRLGHRSTSAIDVEYTAGNEWPLPYAIDWDNVAEIGNAAQVVDGLWELEPGGVRSVQPGYDRLLNIGDVNWRNYEVTAEITVNSVPRLPFPDYGYEPGIGILMRWKGHNETFPHRSGDQPRVGYSPLGSLAWYRYRSTPRLELTDSAGNPVVSDNSGFVLRTGVTYLFRAQVLTTDRGHRYTLYVWPQGEPEENAVRLQTTRPLSEFSSGSLLLVSHKVDATFGNVVVTPVTASTPTISPPGGTFTGPTEVSITTPSPGTRIHYTLDGSEPTESDLRYQGPFAVNSSVQVRARAFAADLTPSAVRTANITITVAEPPQTDTSGESPTPTVDPDLWTVQDPLGDSTISVNAATIEIVVPGGRSHDLWTGRLYAPRLLQPVVNDDLEVEVKFTSRVSSQYQFQGIIAQQDARNLIRFDVYHDGNTARLFNATIVNGRATALCNMPISISGPLYLRLERRGNTWNALFSTDGQNWQTHSTFQHALEVQYVGPFAGNHNAGRSPAPGFRSVIDYFFNSAAIPTPTDEVPEPADGDPSDQGNDPDQGGDEPVTSNTAPTARNDDYTIGEGEPLLLNAPGLLNNDEDADNDSLFVASVDRGAIIGQLTWNPDGSILYDQQDSFVPLSNGQVSVQQFTYTVSDGAGGTSAATVTLRISGSNDAPIATDDQYTADSGIATTLDPLQNDRDPDSQLDLGSLEVLTTPALGDVSLDPQTGQVVYQSRDGAFGADEFQYRIRDFDGAASNAAVVRVQVTPPIQELVSDDFSSDTLDENVWTFADPRGDSTLSLNGSAAELTVPSGRSHDLWTNRLWAPRILQSVSDADMAAEVRFGSSVGSRYQMQGLVAQQDPRNLIRFDTYHDGTSTRLFVARITNGQARAIANRSISPGAAEYLRLVRSGTTWTAHYSADGANWSTLASFRDSLPVSQVGVFVANHGSSSSNSPRHVGIIEHFRNVAE